MKLFFSLLFSAVMFWRCSHSSLAAERDQGEGETELNINKDTCTLEEADFFAHILGITQVAFIRLEFNCFQSHLMLKQKSSIGGFPSFRSNQKILQPFHI